MGPVVVKVLAPCRHQTAGMAQAVKQVFIPYPAIEAFDKAILLCLPGAM